MLSVAQVSNILNTSDAYVRRLCRLGRIRATKVARDWVITTREFDLRNMFPKTISENWKEKRGIPKRAQSALDHTINLLATGLNPTKDSDNSANS